jgi:hypothetical protein
LRLNDRDPDLLEDPSGRLASLRVVRKHAATGKGEELKLDPEDLKVLEIGGPTWVVFPIRRFGTYVVVLAKERP